MQLEGLAGGGTKVAVAPLVGDVVELRIQRAGDLATRHLVRVSSGSGLVSGFTVRVRVRVRGSRHTRHLEPEHELVALRLVLALEAAVLLHVAPVVPVVRVRVTVRVRVRACRSAHAEACG